MNHNKLLKILFVEDKSSDVELEVSELKKEKLQFEYSAVSTRESLLESLNTFKPDIIISDYMVPTLHGLDALKMVKNYNNNIPFIICTGSVNEDIAVECIKAGAQDYVIKEHLTRLPFAVKETVEQVIIQKEKEASDLLLRENEEKLQSIFTAAPVGIGLVTNHILIEINDTFCKMVGYSRQELIGKTSRIFYSDMADFVKANEELYSQIDENGTGSIETSLKCKDGKKISVILNSSPLDKNDYAKGVTFTVLNITRRKMAEEALRKNEHLLQSLTEVSPVGIFRTDLQGNSTYVNPKWSELSGLSGEEALGTGWLKAVHPRDRKKVSENWIKNFGSEQPSIAEFRFLRADGNIVWVLGNAVPEINNNEIVGYIGTITDITFSKHAEEGLRNSEERLKILFDCAPDAYFLYDLQGNFVDGNIAAEKLVGYSKNELVGRNFLKLDLVSLSFLPLVAKLLTRNFLGYGTGPDELVLNCKDGSQVTVEIISHPVKIKNQTLGLGIARDISERLNTQKDLRKSEEKYRRIFDNVQDLFYETSIEGTILDVSPSIRIMSKGQYTREEVIGMSIFSFYSNPEERTALIEQIVEKGAISDFEISLRNRDGELIPCSLSSKIILDSSGLPEKIIGSIRDITDRKNITEALRLAKEKAEISDRLKTDFLNNISHEVRTPLNGILGFAEIMDSDHLTETEKKESLAMLHESSERLLNTITNYMDISLITSGSLSVNKTVFNPVQLLRNIYQKFESRCVNNNLELLLELPESSNNYMVNSDQELCRKIISHFLDNAIKFTEKGKITLSINRVEDRMELSVRDTGIGIHSDSLESIFGRFVKDTRESEKYSEGSGLGLSIAKGLAEAIGGKIILESKKGYGSEFCLSIMAEKRVDPVQVISGKNLLNTKKKWSILVAEDDHTNFYYLNALLTRDTDAKILHALNGKEAINIYESGDDIKLILMDIKMPEMDGFEATRQIKLLNPDVPVIAITAYAMSGDEERIIAAGCDGYLSKPINRKNLFEKIREFIEI
jgi:PAS domain S-box-containing protein